MDLKGDIPSAIKAAQASLQILKIPGMIQAMYNQSNWIK